MVSRWARLGYSIVGVAVAVVSYTVVGTIAAAISGQLSDIQQVEGIGLVVLLYSFPGWVFALPVVLVVHRIDGWRFWTWLALGTALGPMVILVWLFVYSAGKPHLTGTALAALWMPAAVAAVATLVYLQLLLRAQRRRVP